MSCAEIIPKLELMADDELSSEQAAEVLSHIDDCGSCRDNWYGILNLRKAIKERASSFRPSASFEEKILAAVRKEAWHSKRVNPGKALYLCAAALVLVGMAAAFIFRVPGPSLPGTGTQPEVPLKVASSTPISLDDAMANFKQFLKVSGNNKQNTDNDQSDLAALSLRAGFSIKTMHFSGFRLASAQLINAAPGKAPLVRLCYMRTQGKGHDAILCYQAAAGKLVAKGLNEHMIDCKKICCGELEDKSIVYIPGQKTNANEVLLLGTISKSDLMDLVLSSS